MHSRSVVIRIPKSPPLGSFPLTASSDLALHVTLNVVHIVISIVHQLHSSSPATILVSGIIAKIHTSIQCIPQSAHRCYRITFSYANDTKAAVHTRSCIGTRILGATRSTALKLASRAFLGQVICLPQ